MSKERLTALEDVAALATVGATYPELMLYLQSEIAKCKALAEQPAQQKCEHRALIGDGDPANDMCQECGEYVNRKPAQQQEPVATAFDVTIEDAALKMLDDMISPSLDDDCNPVRLIAGKGHSGYGLYICSADYPDEGAELLIEIPFLYTTPPPRKPLTDEQKLNLATNWFAEDWAIKKALGLLRDYEIEAAHSIKEKNT